MIDVFVDINFVIQLFDTILNDNDHTTSSNIFWPILFCLSIFCSFIVNVTIIYKFMKREINNSYFFNDFKQWFDNYSFIIIFATTLSIVDLNNIRILKSKLFNHKAFDAPIPNDNLLYLRVYHIISILIENIPQLIVQIWFHIEYKTWTTLVAISLFMSVFDVLIACTSAFLYQIVRKHQSRNKQTVKKTSVLLIDESNAQS